MSSTYPQINQFVIHSPFLVEIRNRLGSRRQRSQRNRTPEFVLVVVYAEKLERNKRDVTVSGESGNGCKPIIKRKRFAG